MIKLRRVTLVAVNLPWSVWVLELPDMDLLGFTETTSNSWLSAAQTNAAARKQMWAPRMNPSRMFTLLTASPFLLLPLYPESIAALQSAAQVSFYRSPI